MHMYPNAECLYQKNVLSTCDPAVFVGGVGVDVEVDVVVGIG